MKRMILLLALCGGCGPAMTTREQILFGGMIAAQTADYETTRRYVSAGGTEGNPLMGDRPDADTIALFKAGFVGLLWCLGEVWPEHRKALYWVGIISGGAAAGWNEYQYRKYTGE